MIGHDMPITGSQNDLAAVQSVFRRTDNGWINGLLVVSDNLQSGLDCSGKPPQRSPHKAFTFNGTASNLERGGKRGSLGMKKRFERRVQTSKQL